jgi:hypothetical protein
MEGRHVDDDVALAKVARQPAPPVHVQPDAVDLRRVRLVGFRQRVLQRRILRVGRKQGLQHRRHPAGRQRRFQHLSLAGVVQVLVDDMPVQPVLAAHMAECQVRRNAVEPVRRRLGERQRIARPHGQDQAGGVVVEGIEALAADALDECQQVIGVGDLPQGRRQLLDHRRRGRRRRQRIGGRRGRRRTGLDADGWGLRRRRGRRNCLGERLHRQEDCRTCQAG